MDNGNINISLNAKTGMVDFEVRSPMDILPSKASVDVLSYLEVHAHLQLELVKVQRAAMAQLVKAVK